MLSALLDWFMARLGRAPNFCPEQPGRNQMYQTFCLFVSRVRIWCEPWGSLSLCLTIVTIFLEFPEVVRSLHAYWSILGAGTMKNFESNSKPSGFSRLESFLTILIRIPSKIRNSFKKFLSRLLQQITNSKLLWPPLCPILFAIIGQMFSLWELP